MPPHRPKAIPPMRLVAKAGPQRTTQPLSLHRPPAGDTSPLSLLRDNPADPGPWKQLGIQFYEAAITAARTSRPHAAALGRAAQIAAQAFQSPEHRTPGAIRQLEEAAALIQPAAPVQPTPPPTPTPRTVSAHKPTPPPTPTPAPLEVIETAITAHARWQQQPSAETRRQFCSTIADSRKPLLQAGLSGLASSFQLLREFLESVPPSPPALLFIVIDRALLDARIFLREWMANPQITWNRKWRFYFSSLRIALASTADAIPDAPDPTATTSSPDREPVDPELLETFVQEAQGLFEQIESCVIAWERGDNEAAQRTALRRHFHTLKGAANSIDLRDLGADFHALEDYMESMPPHQAGGALFGFLLRCTDDVRGYIQHLESNPATPWNGRWASALQQLSTTSAPLPDTPAATAPAPAETAPESRSVRVDVEKLRTVMNRAGEIIADYKRLEQTFQSLASLRAEITSLGEQLRSLRRRAPAGDPAIEVCKSAEQACDQAVRTFARFSEQTREHSQLFLRQAKRIQYDLSELNMGPVSTLFRRLSRAFRDACKEERKEARWETSGGQTQLDRSVLDNLYGPLLHVVRNAVAHGIETPDDRAAHGKPRTGTVTISAKPLSNQVILEVRDDGAGINAAAVLRRAIQRGLVPETTTSLTPEQTVGLLFMPGFSTKEQVSSVAGRGVGLDVVRGEIEAMNGSVTVSYEAGRGTTWRLKVPLSLSASDALMVDLGEQLIALPLSYIDHCFRMGPGSLKWVGKSRRARIGTEMLPYHELATLLKLPRPTKPAYGVIVDSGMDRAVLGVGRLIARREIIITPLSPILEGLGIYAGATAEADGSLIPILQVPGFLQSLRDFSDVPQAPAADAGSKALRVLLVEDSASARRTQHEALSQLGFVVTLAVDGRAALDILKSESFDLILTDWEMPRLGGGEVIKMLHSLPLAAKTPVVVVSSRHNETFAAEAVSLGAVAALPKPLNPSDLLALFRPTSPLASLLSPS